MFNIFTIYYFFVFLQPQSRKSGQPYYHKQKEGVVQTIPSAFLVVVK